MRRATSTKGPHSHPQGPPILSPGASDRGRPLAHHTSPSPFSFLCPCPILCPSFWPSFCPRPPAAQSLHHRPHPLSRACGGLLPLHRGCAPALALVAAALCLSLTVILWALLSSAQGDLPVIRSAAEAEALRLALAGAGTGAGVGAGATAGAGGIAGELQGKGAARGAGSAAGAGARTETGVGERAAGRKWMQYGGPGSARLSQWGWGTRRASLAHEKHVQQANSRLEQILKRDTVTHNRGVDTATQGATSGTAANASEVDTVTRGSPGVAHSGIEALQGRQGEATAQGGGREGTPRGGDAKGRERDKGAARARGSLPNPTSASVSTPTTTLISASESTSASNPTPTSASASASASTLALSAPEIVSGAVWRDEEGAVIQAHGGGMLFVAERGRYYWYGENKAGETYRLSRKHWARVDFAGISCYSSADLVRWRSHGVVLPPNGSHASHDLHPSKVVERPKVLFNARTRRFVMWMHVDDAEYRLASTGVAVADAPEGPFTYLRRLRPHGHDSRDMTVYQDEPEDFPAGAPPGTPGRAAPAYLLYSSENNAVMHISRLSEDYLDVLGGFVRRLSHQWREAPAVFKWAGVYFMVTSGCTGWRPNAAMVHTASSMMGEWVSLGDPCVGGAPGFSKATFRAQSSFVMRLQHRAALEARAGAQGAKASSVDGVHGLRSSIGRSSDRNNMSSVNIRSSAGDRQTGGREDMSVSTGAVEGGGTAAHRGRSIMGMAGAKGGAGGTERVDPRASLFLFMADRWNELDLQDSRYVWLPLIVEPAPPVQPAQGAKNKSVGGSASRKHVDNGAPRVQIVWQERWTVPQSWL